MALFAILLLLVFRLAGRDSAQTVSKSLCLLAEGLAVLKRSLQRVQFACHLHPLFAD